MQIACDESGYEGEKLVGTSTLLFAHASVCLDVATAADCMRELRSRIRSPALEYKANHLQRDRHRPVLEWLLGPGAPLLGNAHVFLLDKAAYLTRLSGGLEGEPAALNALLRTRGTRGGPIDPLIPAILHAVEHWGRGAPVTIVHDRQKTLTPVRVEWLITRCAGRLAGLTFACSSSDPRIQLADILAGTVRQISEDDPADPRLTALAKPYLSSA